MQQFLGSGSCGRIPPLLPLEGEPKIGGIQALLDLILDRNCVQKGGSEMAVRALLIAATYISLATATFAQDFGKFIGQLTLRPDSNGRTMTLAEPFGFLDTQGREWNVPAGASTDGASIPSVIWFYYAPFTGNHRVAAVIHDYFCVSKTRTWRDTHRVFYDAMRAAGVGEVDAKIMYSAVYYFGPRWGIGAGNRGPGAARASTPELEKVEFERIKLFVEQNNPSLGALEQKLDNQ